jgi:AcrR family transcriptional regulator
MSNSTQEKILHTASRLFYNNGIRATGIDRIIKEAGVSKMSLYKYYASKNDLIMDYLLREEKAIMLHFETTSNQQVSPKNKLLAVFDVNLHMIENRAFKGCPFFNALTEFPHDEDPVRQMALHILNKFWGLIVNLTEQCEVSQARSIALQLSMLLHGSIVSAQVNRNAEAAQYAKEIADKILSGNQKFQY